MTEQVPCREPCPQDFSNPLNQPKGPPRRCELPAGHDGELHYWSEGDYRQAWTSDRFTQNTYLPFP